MALIKIEKMEIPAKSHNKKSPSKYEELYSLKNGECAVYPISMIKVIHSATQYIGKAMRHEGKFVTRYDKSSDVIRVWFVRYEKDAKNIPHK